MKIILGAKHIQAGDRPIGGVQSWIKTVRAELERRGHVVTEWQRDMPIPDERFDLGVLANERYTRCLSEICDQTIGVSHGIINDEAPLGGFDRYLYVSENVRDRWDGQDHIIRQPIDLEFWHDAGRVRTNAVRYSYRRSPTHCEPVSEVMGLHYQQVTDAPHEKARDILQQAELVFATGRAALEAMACGARVVIYDNREYQAPLLDMNLERQMGYSYSGRGGSTPTLKNVVEAALSAEARRDWVEEHHDVRKVVEVLLK